jgi:hypothetical protein
MAKADDVHRMMRRQAARHARIATNSDKIGIEATANEDLCESRTGIGAVPRHCRTSVDPSGEVELPGQRRQALLAALAYQPCEKKTIKT